VNSRIVVLIPAYNPDEKLVGLIDFLREKFSTIIIVDDGSKEETQSIFAAIEPKVRKVLKHPENRGKGCALRTGISWINENVSDIQGIVTADADGQHSPSDIAHIAQVLEECENALVLGVRTFAKGVPFRSVFGNLWSRFFFRILAGFFVSDTQTGLRGIPRSMFAQMLEIKGDRYEYELRMLANARCLGRNPIEVPIQTIYLDNNASSHFRVLRDTWSTQMALFGVFLKRIFFVRSH
jgi:glycosyltransferase involved in cell wall biosynthesis